MPLPSRARRAFLAATVPAALVPVDAEAQDPTRRTRPDTTARLDTVTVTAERRRAATFDVPQAVTVIGRERLADRRGMGLDEVLQEVPGVIALSRAGGTDARINIRGFGSRGAGDRSNAGTTRGVRLLIDGFPETEPDGRTALDLFDIATAEGIEVVRSSASSLWGNAAGGVINLTTAATTTRPFGQLTPVVGSFGLRRWVGRAATPLGRGTLSLAGTFTDFEGWRAHSGGQRSLGLASFVAPVGDRARVGIFAVGGRNAYRIPGPLTRAEADAKPEQANATYASRDERRDNKLGRLGVTLDVALDSTHAVSSALYVNPKVLQRSERGTFRDFNRYHVGGNVVYRNALPLFARGARFTAGVDEAYQDGTILFYGLGPGNTRGADLRDNKKEGANNVGVFAHQELDVTPQLTLGVGARWDAIRYDYQSFVGRRLADVKTFSRVTPKLGATWRLGPTHSVYANLGGGVEAPAGNETDPASTFGQDSVYNLNPLLSPIRSTTYEVGTKRLVALGASGATLSYDAAVYVTDVDDEIVPYRGGRFYFTAGQVRRTGAELGAQARGLGDFTVRTALTWSRHRYTDYRVDSVHYAASAAGRFADFAGNRVVGIPDVAYFAGIGLEPRAARWINAEVGLRGQSRFLADDANVVEVPAFSTLQATVGFGEGLPVGRGLALRGFVTVHNLTDRRYVESAFLNPDVVNGQPVAFEPGLPRNVVFSLSLGAAGRR